MASGGLDTGGRLMMPRVATDTQVLLLRQPRDRQIEHHAAEAPHPCGEGFCFAQIGHGIVPLFVS